MKWPLRMLIAATLTASSLSACISSAQTLAPRQVPVPKEYFGLHMHRAATTSAWPTAPFGAWRLWDAYAGWAWIEPQKGKWKFDQLDKLVALADQHKVELLLPLGPSPQWASARPLEKSVYGPGRAAEPKDIADWRNYVRTVATRYKGKIRQYEIWNEPNLKGFYTGSVQDMVSLTREAYKILKEVDPQNILVSPSATGGHNGPQWLDDFLANGGGKECDIIGFHAYVSPAAPESMVPLIARVRKVMKKHGVAERQLWNTEAGWFIQNVQTEVKPEPSGYRSRVLSQEEGAAYVVRGLLLNWASGIDRFYWYAWDNEFMGFTEPDGKTVKLPGHVYARVYDWLHGKTVTSCRTDDSALWTCGIAGKDGEASWIVWSEDKVANSLRPKDLGARRMTTLEGKTKDISKVDSLEVGSMPVFLQK